MALWHISFTKQNQYRKAFITLKFGKMNFWCGLYEVILLTVPL